jgi:hypothetical protein
MPIGVMAAGTDLSGIASGEAVYLMAGLKLHANVPNSAMEVQNDCVLIRCTVLKTSSSPIRNRLRGTDVRAQQVLLSPLCVGQSWT